MCSVKLRQCWLVKCRLQQVAGLQAAVADLVFSVLLCKGTLATSKYTIQDGVGGYGAVDPVGREVVDLY